MKKMFNILGKVLIFILIFVVTIVADLYLMCLLFCYGPSESARDLFVTTMLETGQMKFVVGLVMPDDKVQEIVDTNSMKVMENEIDNNLIKIDDKIEKEKDIELKEISGNNFFAKMLIIKDPSRVKLSTIYDGSWKEYGITLDKLVEKENAVAGVNGGLYQSTGNKGGSPLGVVVKDGKIEYNNPTGIRGLYLIGFDTDNLLQIINLENKNKSDIEKIIKESKIRDAVAFQEESSDANNHFVKLVINGEARETKGSGSGANPRTAIGQKKDGTILLLVTDGRGANGHLGATAADLIDIMVANGAVNAANLDGGSSSSMYYNGNYEMTSVTLYYSNSSWRLPTAFVVE